MSNRRERTGSNNTRASPGWNPLLAGESSRSVTQFVTALAAVIVGVTFATRVVRNAPVNLPEAFVGGGPHIGVAPGPLAGLAMGVAAVAAVIVGLTDADPAAAIGLLFVGVFGLLALVSRSAALPASAAVVAGLGAVVVANRDRIGRSRLLSVTALYSGVALALASGVGEIAAVRPVASTLSLLGVGLLPLFAATDTEALLGGGLAFAAVVAVGLSQPFVTGAVTLVGGGVVGATLPVVAFAVAGAVTTASAAARQGRWRVLSGVALLGFVGVPATLPRALPFALGVAVLATMGGDR